jgi:tetratricopeptide (TPR) repeat protein
MEDKIDRFVNKQMNAAERLAFLAEIEADESLREELAFAQKVKAAATWKARTEMKSFLASRVPLAKPKRLISKWAAAAALLLAMGVIGLAFWLVNRAQSPEQIYMAFYQTHPNLEMPSLRGEGEESDLFQAYLAYDNGDFKQAAALFLVDYHLNDQAISGFYGAISLMELEQFEDALALWEELAVPQAYQVPSAWYHALTLLRLDDLEQARRLLDQVEESTHPLAAEARRLLPLLRF